MSKKLAKWHKITVYLAVSFVLFACSSLPLVLTPTATGINLSIQPGGVGGNSRIGAGGGNGSGNGAGGGAGIGQNGPGTGSGNGSGNGQNGGVTTGSYVVQQIETLGKESIAGIVCSTSLPFSVSATSPHVAWVFNFFPNMTWNYAYSIPSAGESHDASGNYAISPPDSSGVLLLTMKGSDHVVFKGFDGKIPVQYKFNLVPASATCP